MGENKLKTLSGDELVYNAGRAKGSDSAEATQAELTRRLTGEIQNLNVNLKESNESARKFSLVLIALAFTQVIIALFQLLLSSVSSESKILGTFLVIAATIIFVYLFRLVFKSTESEEESTQEIGG